MASSHEITFYDAHVLTRDTKSDDWVISALHKLSGWDDDQDVTREQFKQLPSAKPQDYCVGSGPAAGATCVTVTTPAPEPKGVTLAEVEALIALRIAEAIYGTRRAAP